MQDNEGYALAARGHYAFLYGPEDSGNAVHLGASARYRNFDNDTFDSQVQLPPAAVLPLHRHAQRGYRDGRRRRRRRLGRAGVRVGHTARSRSRARSRTRALQRKNGEDDANNLWGGYLGASYFLTGEHRNYDPKRGVFDRVKVEHPLQDGGAGAWRWPRVPDHIDLNNDGVKGGEQISYIGGINWYPNNFVRFILDGAITQVFDAANSGAAARRPPAI